MTSMMLYKTNTTVHADPACTSAGGPTTTAEVAPRALGVYLRHTGSSLCKLCANEVRDAHLETQVAALTESLASRSGSSLLHATTGHQVACTGIDKLEKENRKHPRLQEMLAPAREALRDYELELKLRLQAEEKDVLTRAADALVGEVELPVRAPALAGALDDARELMINALVSAPETVLARPREGIDQFARRTGEGVINGHLRGEEIAPSLVLLYRRGEFLVMPIVAYTVLARLGGFEHVVLEPGEVLDATTLQTVATLHEPGGSGAYTTLSDALAAARAL